MIVTSACRVSRLVISWQHRRPTDQDADAVHIVMGVAMAGMLVPRLRVSWTGAGRADVTGCAASFPQAPRERSAGSRRARQHHGGAEPARQLPGAARACVSPHPAACREIAMGVTTGYMLIMMRDPQPAELWLRQ